MSIALEDNPASGWAVRGQKLIISALSDEVTQIGFKYGIVVIDQLSGKQYEFLIDPDPITSYMYFDLYPLIILRNEDQTINPHTAPVDIPAVEPQGSGWNDYQIQITEWYDVAGVFTKNEESTLIIQSQAIFNAYYQQSDGYQPNEETGSVDHRFSLPFLTLSKLWSARNLNTHTWDYQTTFSIPQAMMIPSYTTDWGSLAFQTGNTYLKTNTATGIEIYFWYGDIESPSVVYKRIQFPTEDAFIHVGVCPQNLEASTLAGVPKPSLYPDWIYYTIRAISASNTACSYVYAFYNADAYGQHECRHDYIRLAWVGSRAGWEYFNFIKRNEFSNETERKQFVRGLFGSPTSGQPYFLPNARVWNDRQVIAQQYLTIQSDWIQEHEFEFLRSLFVSNQVEIIQRDGSRLPVSIEENNFVERRARDGKLINVTMKLKIGHYYWT